MLSAVPPAACLGRMTLRATLAQTKINIQHHTSYGGIPGEILAQYLADGPGSATSISNALIHVCLESTPNLWTAVREVCKRVIDFKHTKSSNILFGVRCPDPTNMADHITYDVVEGNLLRLLSPEPGHGMYFGGLLVDSTIAATNLSKLRELRSRPRLLVTLRDMDLTENQTKALSRMLTREAYGVTPMFWTERSPAGVMVSLNTKSIFHAPIHYGCMLPDRHVQGGILSSEHGSGRKRVIYALIHLTASLAAAWANKDASYSTQIRAAQTIIVTEHPEEWEAESVKYGVRTFRHVIVAKGISDGHVVSIVTQDELQQMDPASASYYVWRIVYDNVEYDDTSFRSKRSWLIPHKVDKNRFNDFITISFWNGVGVVAAYAKEISKNEAFGDVIRKALTVNLSCTNSPLEITNIVVEVIDPVFSGRIRCDDVDAMVQVCTGHPVDNKRALFYPVAADLDPCAICHCIQTNSSQTDGCNHTGCFVCLDTWRINKPLDGGCMMCRKPFTNIICKGFPVPAPIPSFIKLNQVVHDVKQIKGRVIVLTGNYRTVLHLRDRLPKHIIIESMWTWNPKHYPATDNDDVTVVVTDYTAHLQLKDTEMWHNMRRFNKKTMLVVLTYVVKDTQEAEEVYHQAIK